MTEWREAIWLSFSAMIAALVLSFVALLGAFARQAAALQAEEDNAIAIMKEYRKYAQYENTQLYPQDVISAIARTRGEPEVYVDTDEGPGVSFTWQWTESTNPSEFSPTYLSGIFPLTGKYQSTIVKDLNGSIIRLEFRRN